MALRVHVEPNLLEWAVDRVGWGSETIERKFPKFEAWTTGDVEPTLKQLEGFARAAHVPVGYLFLPEPPVEDLPIPDFRTRQNADVGVLSPDLRDTIYMCQARQEWYRNYASTHGYPPPPFVGSASVADAAEPVADEIRRLIDFNLDDRASFPNWEAALRQLIDLIENIGVLVMVNGIVGSDTHRKLDPDEFRGLALSDDLAPLIFVNGADTKAAQIFTLVHELAHIWLGESALSDAPLAHRTQNQHELWCNRVAAEVLVPLGTLRTEFRGTLDVEELDRLARFYRVSTLVVLKRLFDADFLDWNSYQARYRDERDRVVSILSARKSPNGGGNFYYSAPLRLSRQFARAVISDTFEGGTAYRDAYRLLGTAKPQTFATLATELGVA